MRINILIPMAGKKVFDVPTEDSFPRYLKNIDGKLLIERAAEPFIALKRDKKIVVVAPKKQVEKYRLDNTLTLLDSSLELCLVNEDTQGAVCSALLAVEHLDLDQPLVISSFEQVLDFDIEPYLTMFIEKDVDAGVLTFEGIHPKWSYVRVDEDNFVLQAEEKTPISKNAVAGFYFFKTASHFVEAAKSIILNDVTHRGMFYTSHTLNELILNDGLVYSLPIDRTKYFHFHDEQSLESYEEQFLLSKADEYEVLSRLTREYISAFNSRCLGDVLKFFSDNFFLSDPNGQFVGKEAVASYLAMLFETASELAFIAQSVLVDGQRSVIEFELRIDGKEYVGTDVITWDGNNQMSSMCAYLYEQENGKDAA